MIFLQLFWGFLQVGCFSFGGAYSAIPLISEVVRAYGWLTEEDLAVMIAVSESTPGPIMVNLATYVGSVQAGIPGAAVATLAVILPAFLIILLIMAVLKNVVDKPAVQAVLNGMTVSVTGVILATGAWMLFSRVVALSPAVTVDFKALLLAVILCFLMFGMPKFFHKKISPIPLILISAVLGMIVYGIPW